MAYKKFGCCCCSVITCSKVIASLGLIGGVYNLVSGILFLSGVNYSLITGSYTVIPYASYIGEYGYIAVTFIISLSWMVPDGLMLYGISTNKHGFLLPWLIVHMVMLVVSFEKLK